MRTRQLIVWFAIGLLGLALAAGVTYAATQLSSQRIGLSAEPPSAGDELVPPPARKTHTTRNDPPPTTTTAPPPVVTAPDDTGESEYRPGQRDGDRDGDD